MKWFMPIVLVGVLFVLGFQSASQPASSTNMHASSAATYEQLATAIIAIRETETSLVKGILMHSHALAERELEAAIQSEGRSRIGHFETAAREITNIATEGDRRIQAVRQRLLEAGHHHHTDAETKDDYIFVNGAERKMMLELAGRVARLDSKASENDVRSVMNEVTKAFQAAIKDE